MACARDHGNQASTLLAGYTKFLSAKSFQKLTSCSAVITNDYEKKYGDGEMVCSKAFTENHYTNQGFAHSI